MQDILSLNYRKAGTAAVRRRAFRPGAAPRGSAVALSGGAATHAAEGPARRLGAGRGAAVAGQEQISAPGPRFPVGGCRPSDPASRQDSRGREPGAVRRHCIRPRAPEAARRRWNPRRLTQPYRSHACAGSDLSHHPAQRLWVSPHACAGSEGRRGLHPRSGPRPHACAGSEGAPSPGWGRDHQAPRVRGERSWTG